ncbi:MAG: PfkB family carbohydrate kinase [Deltaproteobacteria bacterium]
MKSADILVIGAVLWDIIGRAPLPLRLGNDVPGLIIRHPGGVGLNIALALRRFGRSPAVLSAIGQDAEGDELVSACEGLGLDLSLCLRHAHPTDAYMAIEGANGLIAAIADAHGLERAGAAILEPLGGFDGPVVVDGNLTGELLTQIATDKAHAGKHLMLAPASPGKALRLTPFLSRAKTTLYLNREEAELLAGREFDDAKQAASTLHAQGAPHILVTDGQHGCAEARDGVTLNADSPQVAATRVTGAGDTFMAAHIVAQAKRHPRDVALRLAARAAARHVSGEDAHESWIPDV